MLRNRCPVCQSESVVAVRADLQPHPYIGCGSCGFYYQKELIPKVYEASHEVSGDLMSDGDKAVNRSLAGWISRVAALSPGDATLDIGAKYPFLAHCFGELGAEAHAMDGIPEIIRFSNGLKVKAYHLDFEEALQTKAETFAHIPISFPIGFPALGFSLVTMIHVIEHMYRPLAAFQGIYNMLKPGGHFFIRCPASDVSGIERDFTPGHYDIHPQIWSRESLHLAAGLAGFLVKYEAELQPGQRDLLLVRPQ